MDLLHELLIYVGILAAAAIEGEVTYAAASILVAQGRLHPLGVIVAGAAGAATGDQFYFYLLRGRLSRWLARFPALAQRAAPLGGRVRRHQSAMVLLIRFVPGLRIALAVACAYAGISAVRFSLLNFAAAVVWAVALLVVIAWAGPAYLSTLGLTGWKAALATGMAVAGILYLVGRLERRTMSAR